MSRRQMNSQASFIAMSVFIVAIIILIHGTMAFQLSKIKMNEQLKEASHVIMEQFIMSYGNYESVKAQLVEENIKQFDKEVIKIYDKIDAAFVQKSYDILFRPLTDDALFDISIRPNTPRTRRYIEDKIGVEYSELRPYKIVDYSINSDGKVHISKHVLVGKSSDNKGIIIIEMSINYGSLPMKKAESIIENILETNSYLSSFSSKFYVVDQQGVIQYSTGNKINTDIMEKVDSYTGLAIKDIVLKGKTSFVNVIYKSDGAMHKSGLRIQFNPEVNHYYILELDQESIYSKINSYILYFWYISFLFIGISIAVVIVAWRKNN